jgi:hypothetical protein
MVLTPIKKRVKTEIKSLLVIMNNCLEVVVKLFVFSLQR